ncbi:MAG: copper amine oxidase N-terminal domain-containing protein [Armatimonadota bacterium]
MTNKSYLISVFTVYFVLLISLVAVADKAIQKSSDIQAKPQLIAASDMNEIIVPARDIAESFGSRIQWNGSSGELRIAGDYGTGLLRIGDRNAVVNGVPIYLPSAPYILGGQVQVPIIFFNDLYDMALVWNRFFNRFEWKPIVPPRPGSLRRPPMIIYGPGRPSTQTQSGQSTGITVGEVVRVMPSDNNQKFVVKVSGKNLTYTAAKDTIIIRGRIGGYAMEVPLSDIRPGDRVVIRFNPDTTISSIRAQYMQISGTVSSVAANTVLLNSGETLRLTPKTGIVMSGNMSGDIKSIKSGDTIIASISPISRMAYVIRVNPEPVQLVIPQSAVSDQSVAPVSDDPVMLNAYGPFRTGDVISIRIQARSGSQASFSIPGIKGSIPMTEVQSGVFQGSYTVQTGDTAIRQPVTVNIREADGMLITQTSKNPVTIQTVSGYLPRIVSPRQGSEVGSPIVVEGQADPGATVRISIEYRRDMKRVLPIEGISAYTEVKAGSDGRWRTGPLPVTSPFASDETDLSADFGIFNGLFRQKDEPPIIYTIRAVSVGTDGSEKSSFSIDVTKRPGIVTGG